MNRLNGQKKGETHFNPLTHELWFPEIKISFRYFIFKIYLITFEIVFSKLKKKKKCTIVDICSQWKIYLLKNENRANNNYLKKTQTHLFLVKVQKTVSIFLKAQMYVAFNGNP